MAIIPNYSLAPYRKSLDRKDLLHLLRRCLFGVGHDELRYFRDKSVDQCLDILLRQTAPIKPPLQDDPDIIDPLVPSGQGWINAPYENENIDKKRRLALKGWWVGQIIGRDYSLTEKMTLFWHNHFVTEMDVVKDARYSYRYVNMLRVHALGNFKKLIREGTTNIAMLVYLNGNSNNSAAPNENYGRELMELFTLGKGNGVNYSEDDVRAAAKVLSGWVDNKDTFESDFHPPLHDTTDKNFSLYFDNMVIRGKEGAQGAKEVDELVDMIFKKKDVAKYVCRNLYKWFVSSHIDDSIETHVIDELADRLIAANFEIASVLRILLGSEHFFDKAFRGCIVKSPVDFFVGATKEFDIDFPKQATEMHLCWTHYYFYIEGLAMSIGDPPSVAGWPAFYQSPKFHQWWINSYTLLFRMKIIDSLYSADGLNCNGPNIKFDFLLFAKQFETPWDVNSLVEQSVEFLCTVKVNDQSKSELKSILLSGQKSDHYWTEAWKKYSADMSDKMAQNIVEERLRAFFSRIMKMPEYQLI